MRDSDRKGHVLIWMRDAMLAERLRVALAYLEYESTWAVALPEAIAVLDRSFPRAVVCTLRGQTPSLMDLETLFAYQVLGHRFITLPQVPIWATAASESRCDHESGGAGTLLRSG